ncbi:MAG TPA: hypothetical protein VH437_05780 [Terriglobales bacterium]
MASVTEKTKYLLDWLQHGYLLVQILTSAAFGQFAKALLLTYTHIPPIWIAPIWLGISSITLTVLVWAIGPT